VSSETVKITISIMGKEYQLACPVDEQQRLQQAAQNLDQQMRVIRDNGKVVGLDRIAIMAAVNLSHQLLIEQDKQVPDTHKEQHFKSMNYKLDLALSRMQANNTES